MKMSKKPKQLNKAEIYLALLDILCELEDVDKISVVNVPNITSALARLEVSVKYRMFDLEATRRERDYLKGLLNDKTQK